MAVSERLKALVDQMPDLDPDPRRQGMFTQNIDKGKIEKAVAEIAQGGAANVEGLIEMLGAPGSDENVKPHYALRCVGNYALITKDENARRQFSETLAAHLDGKRSGSGLSDYNKAFLCQELQWAGRREAVPALGNLLPSEELVDPAAMALVAIREGATDELLRALPQAKGKCRLSIVDALAALAEPPAAAALKQALQDEDREVRLAAGAGLAKLGDASAVDLLIKAADVKPGWERIQATKHCLVLAERLTAAGKKELAAKIYAHLRDTRTDPSEKYVRDVAEKALADAS
jgi:HEAT repeat protein